MGVEHSYLFRGKLAEIQKHTFEGIPQREKYLYLIGKNAEQKGRENMRITQYKTVKGQDGIQLIKEKSCNYLSGESLTSPDRVYRMLCDVFRHNIQTEEYVYLICTHRDGKIAGVFEISHGTLSQSFCGAREIMQKALLCNVDNIIIAHNHPSGSPTPSKTDIATYRKIKEAGELMGINLLDNIIVGDTTYCSFVENGIK